MQYPGQFFTCVPRGTKAFCLLRPGYLSPFEHPPTMSHQAIPVLGSKVYLNAMEEGNPQIKPICEEPDYERQRFGYSAAFVASVLVAIFCVGSIYAIYHQSDKVFPL